MSKVRVFLADDHPVVRGGLRALVDAQSDMEVVGEAGDGLATVQGVQELRPDVALMDLSMPGLGGGEATERIRQTCPEVRILALTAHEDRGYLQLLLKAGASGYILKRAAAEDLVRAIRSVAAGDVYLDPAVAGQLISGLVRRAPAGTQAPGADLSDREAEVLRLIAQGHAIKQIAADLEVSVKTIETYKARASEKMGLRSRADIVRYALRRGWLKSE